MSTKRLEEARRKAKAGRTCRYEVRTDGDPLRPWSAKHFRMGHLEFQDLQVDGPADNEAFLKMARELGAGPVAAPVVAASAPAQVEDSPLLSVEIEHHLADMARRKLAPNTITESRHTLRIKYRKLSILQMIEAGKRDNVPASSTYTLNKHNQKLGSFFNGLVNQDLMNKNPLTRSGGRE